MTDVAMEAVPTSFGNLRPVGHVLLALRDRESQEACIADLRAANFTPDGISQIAPSEAGDELSDLIDKASGASGFGYEIVLMKRYLKLARDGCRWLLVKVDGTDDARRIADMAARHQALSAVHYRRLVEEDLLA